MYPRKGGVRLKLVSESFAQRDNARRLLGHRGGIVNLPIVSDVFNVGNTR